MDLLKVNFLGFGGNTPYYIVDALERHYDLEITIDSDLVFVGSFEPYKYTSELAEKTSIFFPGEAIFPDFNLYDYAIGFDRIDFGDRYLRHMLFPYSMQRGSSVQINDPLNRKFCNFIYHNPDAHPNRDKFFQMLSEAYKPVYSLGKHLRNVGTCIEPREGNWYQGSIEAKSQYKFSLAFENATYAGYTSEKITSSFQARTIPIYWGNPDVALDFNAESFVNCHEHKSFKDVIDYVQYLDRNDEAYLKMLNASKGPCMQKEFYKNQIQELEDFLCAIVKNSREEIRRKPSGYWNKRYIEQLHPTKPTPKKNRKRRLWFK
jgi:hypothetical protein